MANTIVKYGDDYVIPVTIDKEFGYLINSIGKEYLDSEGLSREYLDIIKRYSEYSNANLKDYSIEGNSNATGQKNYMSRSEESGKGLEKLKNYYNLWLQLREDVGLVLANKCIKSAIEGSLLVHDLTNGGVDLLYCSTLLAKDVMAFGRPYNDLHSKPPKYADSFIGQIIELIIDASSRYAGAIAIPDINVAFSFFTKKENLSDKQVTQLYQRIVHLVNNPYRSGSQSPFFNMSLFTYTGLCEAFGGYKYPNGESALDYIDEILKNQLIFSNYFGQGIEDSYGIKKPVAFPVVTMNIVRESFKDDYDYIQKILACYTKFDNINIYIGNADKWASCCYSYDTKVLAKNNDELYYDSFKALFNKFGTDNVIEVLSDGKWKKAKLVKLASRPMYNITLSNGLVIKETDNHRNNTLNEIKLTRDLQVGDYLSFTRNEISGNNLNTYTDGFKLGNKIYYEHDENCIDNITNYICNSVEFRKGILEGIVKLSNEKIIIYNDLHCIFVTDNIESTNLKDFITTIAASIGYTIIFNNSTIRLASYDPIKFKNNYNFISITSIERDQYYNEDVYCFVMQDKSNDMFTLANGLHNYNCRLINDPSKRNSTKKNAMNSFGSGALSEQIVGSSRVVSINLYDIALKTKQRYTDDFKEHYFEILKENMDLGKAILVAQRHLVEKRLNEGFNIFYNIGWIKLDDYFSTYGAGGLHEAAKTICDGKLTEDYTEEELNFAMEIPKYMEKYADDNSDDFAKLNVEFLTPLESGASRLGKRVDITYNKKGTFISNQLLPLSIKVSIDRRLQIENALGGATSAGGILHIGTEGEMPIDIKMAMLKKIITKYPHVEHYAYNKTSSYCEDGHLTLANVDICPFCHKPIVEKILRVIGYFKPTRNWSAPRQNEFEKRKFADINEQYDFVKDDNNEQDDNAQGNR